MAYQAGIGVNEFWDLTPRDVSRRIEAYNNQEQQEWERVRFLSYYMISPYLEKDSSSKSIADVIPMPWDKKQQPYYKPKTEKEKKWLQSVKKHLDKQNGLD